MSAENSPSTPVLPVENSQGTAAKPRVIFFGNGPLAEATLAVLRPACDVLFCAHTREDLARAAALKREFPDATGVLASFGVLIKPDFLELFEPEGILNIHPSLLPTYRGSSPIESAILDGATEFSVSVMKLAEAMDAGPVYYQTTLSDLPLDKFAIYRALATAGAEWIVAHLGHLSAPVAQDEARATFTAKISKEQGNLHPADVSAAQIFRQIVAFQKSPKPHLSLAGRDCVILAAHPATSDETALLRPAAASDYLVITKKLLALRCADDNFVVLDRVQPAGRAPMAALAFKNGYLK